MKITIGIMGSANKDLLAAHSSLKLKAEALGTAIAARGLTVLTGATTGVVYAAGKAAHEAGAIHIGISPAANALEHVERYGLPTDACDLLIYTGFGLKGRNVVLVRSCDIVVFVAGGMGSLNEFTIAHDEGKIIGCLTQTGGVADQAGYLLQTFSKQERPQVFQGNNPEGLISQCLQGLLQR
ncbi:MAG TPA: hypothetical protein VIV66_22415 [Pyrinomonadaceae bacterium]